MASKSLSSAARANSASAQKAGGRYCTVDQWHAQINESLIVFGPHAKRVHRLDDGREKFGLGEIIRHYGQESRPELLSLLESLDEANPTFDFRSLLELADGNFAEVHWVGKLDMASERISGVIVITEGAGLSLLADGGTH